MLPSILLRKETLHPPKMRALGRTPLGETERGPGLPCLKNFKASPGGKSVLVGQHMGKVLPKLEAWRGSYAEILISRPQDDPILPTDMLGVSGKKKKKGLSC